MRFRLGPGGFRCQLDWTSPLKFLQPAKLSTSRFSATPPARSPIARSAARAPSRFDDRDYQVRRACVICAHVVAPPKEVPPGPGQELAWRSWPPSCCLRWNALVGRPARPRTTRRRRPRCPRRLRSKTPTNPRTSRSWRKQPADAAKKRQADEEAFYQKWQFWAVTGGMSSGAVALIFGGERALSLDQRRRRSSLQPDVHRLLRAGAIAMKPDDSSRKCRCWRCRPRLGASSRRVQHLPLLRHRGEVLGPVTSEQPASVNFA